MLAEIFLPTADTTSGSAANASLNTDTLDEEETITDWLAFSGDYVQKGQVLGRAEMSGAIADIAAPAAGVLHILVPVDRPLPALSLVGVIDTVPDARSSAVTFTPAEPPPVEPASPAAAPEQVTPLAPVPSPRSWDHRPPGSATQDAPRPPATRLPLLSRLPAARSPG